MEKSEANRINELLNRISRIMSADEWSQELNPTQWTALTYLSKANRFSCSPSHVAEYMATTRGTVSQTLKTLARKGLISETRSDHDKRSIAYDVTEEGRRFLHRKGIVEQAAASLQSNSRKALLSGLEDLLQTAIDLSGSKPFGVCRTCMHHRKSSSGNFCRLLDEPLSATEAEQLCHEHTSML